MTGGDWRKNNKRKSAYRKTAENGALKRGCGVAAAAKVAAKINGENSV